MKMSQPYEVYYLTAWGDCETYIDKKVEKSWSLRYYSRLISHLRCKRDVG